MSHPPSKSKATPKARRKIRPSVTQILTDPVESAAEAGLRYVSDQKPGLGRRRSGKSFRYIDASGKPVKDPETLKRIRSLVIPPAWQNVWISPDAKGHLQATGRDVRGRKQSRYHPRWREVRDATKYQRMTQFAAALPAIRAHVAGDLKRQGLPREKILATIVSLMEHTLIRVGNEEYARENKSFGLTTMRNRHVEVLGSEITFSFQGKSRVHHTINLRDRRLAGIVKKCVDLPGYELFQYLDAEGQHHAIDSADVNAYLHDIAGEHFTAKDFRTWAGSVLASVTLDELPPFATVTEAKRNVVQAIKSVATRLGNTPSVCRKCYVHPAVIDAYLGGTSRKAAKKQLDAAIEESVDALRQDEQALVDLLKQRAMLEA
jgi:DNA topoisomerase-1